MGFLVKLIKSLVPALCAIIIATGNVDSITYQCETVENYDSRGQQYCVFRGVQYSSNTTDIAFQAPTEPALCVAFENSQMEHLPKEFLEKFGNDLKVLNVTGCNLTSVVITKSMEELIATGNYIHKIIVHQSSQSSPMRDLYLQSNLISDISNITRHCKNLRILDLSSNTNLVRNSDLDFSMFNGLNQLEYLSLTDVGALYILHDKKVSLPSLTLLDLSENNLLPVDLQVDYFKSFKSLEILRLNNNGFNQLDYNYLTQIESLKGVYLEGNEFSCSYLKAMIKHLNDNGKQTPVEHPASHCPAGYNIEQQMCCKSENLAQVNQSSPATSSHVASTQSPISTKIIIPITPTKKSAVPWVMSSAEYCRLNLLVASSGLVITLLWMRK